MKKFYVYMLLFAFTASVPTLSSPASLVIPANTQPGEPDSATIQAAIAEFKNLPKKERKERIKEVKKQLKKFKQEKKAGNSAKVDTVVLVILAILLPPLAVYLHQGEINSKFWIALLLWFLFILPGVIYALIVVLGDE